MNERKTMTENQYLFILEAKKQGFDVEYDYTPTKLSGVCTPAIRLSKNKICSYKFVSDVWLESFKTHKVIYALP